MPLPFPFDFKNPDYVQVFEHRLEALTRIRKDPACLPHLKQFYRSNPAQFIIDWGLTIDPRNPEIGLPAVTPFILFPKQEEWVNWLMERWKTRTPGACAKSREVGLSWLALATNCTLALFYNNLIFGFGSYKEAEVDLTNSPKSLFYKARFFIDNLPKEFKGTWDIRKHAPHMRIILPDTDSILLGESGDNLGRGGRYTIFNHDEAAFHMRPEMVEASLSMVTNCRIDISTPRGMTNPFARKVFGGKISVFYFRWQDDPRKDEAWYKKKCDEIDDPVIIAQEIDLNFSASVEGIVIPAEWVLASIDAHKKLGIEITGEKQLGLDIADQGRDINAVAGKHGILIELCEGKSGVGSNFIQTVRWAVQLADEHGYSRIRYDADGLGAGIRGDAEAENEKREENDIAPIVFVPFRGSGEVVHPDNEVYPPKPGSSYDPYKGRLNKDYFANAKAQAWWALRKRFSLTYRAVVKGETVNFDEIISLSSKMNNLNKLIVELSQPTYKQNEVGKIIIDKMPEGARSPNYADAAVIVCAPEKIRAMGLLDV